METPPLDLATRRRRVLFYGVIPVAITAILALWRPSLLHRLDYSAYDGLLRAVDTGTPDGSIVIVDVDDRSLSSVGQWPWRRDLIGQLIARIRELGATTIALDILFAEPDRTVATALATDPPDDRRSVDAPTVSDLALADTFQQGRVVVGYALTFGSNGAANGRQTHECVLHPLAMAIVRNDDDADSPVFQASGVVCSLPILARAAGRSGFLNAAPDADGILRRVPLLLEYEGQMYPGLALAAVAASTGARNLELHIANVNASSLTLGERDVPLDGKGNVLVRYRGKKRAFPYVSAGDILAGRVAAGTFRDKLVFVGATALGTQEVVATPFDTLFTGVEVQATVADNLLRHQVITRAEKAAAFETLAVVLLGMAVVILVARTNVAWGGLITSVGILAVWGIAAWLLTSQGVFLSPLFPTIAMAAALATTTVIRYRVDLAAMESAEQRARRETEAASYVKDEFLMTMSHELRTPLTAISGWAQMLATSPLRDDQKSRALKTIKRNVLVQTQLIEDLLDVSSMISGTFKLKMQSVNLADVVRAALEAGRPALEAKQLRLEISIDTTLDPVQGDPDRLQQVIWNLLSNAIKFTDERGLVQLRLERAGTYAQIVMSDNGVGITPEFLPYAFDRFRQQDGGPRRSYAGVGLGLGIVRHLVELHGGSVKAESAGPNQGSTFRVLLPMMRPTTRE